MNKTINELVIERYGSIDNFIKETNIDLGRTYLYQLLNDESVNPTISAIIKLADALKLDPLDVASEYSTRYRDFWLSHK